MVTCRRATIEKKTNIGPRNSLKDLFFISFEILLQIHVIACNLWFGPPFPIKNPGNADVLQLQKNLETILKSYLSTIKLRYSTHWKASL